MITAMRRTGDATEIISLEAARTSIDHDLLWLHFDTPDGDMLRALLTDHVPDTVVQALVAVETRPRCEPVDDGVLLNLRVPGIAGEDGGDVLVSLRLWALAKKVVTVSFRKSPVVDTALVAMRAGALTDPGDAIIALVGDTAQRLDPVIADLGDDLDTVETSITPGTPFSVRRSVTRIRSQAINYRRFIAPQRQALDRLAMLPLPWIDGDERAAVRNAADRFARMAEELESVRERASVVQDELTALRAERIDSRSLQISIAAMIFLPLTFVTGLLGMNVAGIPFALEEWAFWGVTAFCIIIAAVIALWFIAKRWSSN